jgi:hypothetical protein
MGGWMDGWVGGWMEGKAGLRIAYSNQKLLIKLHQLQPEAFILFFLSQIQDCHFTNILGKRVNFLKNWPPIFFLYFQLEIKEAQCQELSVRLAGTENRLLDAERRVEALATLQSHRWMEFSKMADNMKELSHNMLAQSKSNTRKAAIRADLDEELDL